MIGRQFIGGVRTGLLVALLLCGGLHRSRADEMALGDLYRLGRQAAAEILVDGHHSGSGSFVSRCGQIVTAAHVIGRPERKLEVLAADGSRHPARLEAVNLGHDLALLRVEQCDDGYVHLKLAGHLPPPGTTVLLCSTAAYRRVLLQPGMMARDDTTFEYQDEFVEVTQVAALIQEGTSGGAWLNQRGELIGVQSGSVTVKSTPAGIANVVPVSAVRRLIETGRNAASPTIGAFLDELWLLSADELRRYPPGSEGVVVQSVKLGGPAARAELSKGDVISGCEGQPIRFRDALIRQIRGKQPGEQIELTVLRPDGAGIRTVRVDVGRMEVGWPDN